MPPLLPPEHCMSKLITRADDTEEVVKERLRLYHELVMHKVLDLPTQFPKFVDSFGSHRTLLMHHSMFLVQEDPYHYSTLQNFFVIECIKSICNSVIDKAVHLGR